MGRKTKREATALSERAFTPDFALHLLDQRPGHRQAVTRGGLAAGGLRREPHPLLEQPGLVLLAQARPFVAHAANHAGRITRHLDRNLLSGWRILDRVGQEVVEYRGDRDTVRPSRPQVRGGRKGYVD